MSAGGPEHGEAPVNILAEIVEAVRDFVNADDWDASRQVVEARQALLFQPEVETLFEQNIAGARAGGNQRAVEMLEMHLALLRLCKAIGIAEAFKQLEERNAEEQEEENDLPFDAELIPRTVLRHCWGAHRRRWCTCST